MESENPIEPGVELPKTELGALELGEKAGLAAGELGADGEIIFGDRCLILSQVESDKGKKLKLTIEPGRCGEVMGEQLVKYLVETADTDLAIEIKHSTAAPAEPPAAPVTES